MGKLGLERGRIIEVHSQFASDDNDAERAQHEGTSTPPPGCEAAPGESRETPNEFRRDAKIWQLYLADAEERSKYKVDLWYAGVDSLLIFAGLFAGVVSSFLLDSRRDLQPNNEPHLLTSILDFLRNESTGGGLSIPHASYWVTGLWILSLFTTMFSVIFGILAKVGLAKHMLTTKKGQEAEDAYLRYKVDSHVDHFYGKKILVLAPLLVQTASILFLAGLIVQTLGDSLMLGRLLLGLSLTTSLGYVATAFFPFNATPGVKLRVTLGEIIDAVFGRVPFSKSRSYTPKDDPNEGAAEILLGMVLSRNPVFVNEAIAEIARPSFKEKWTNYFCKTTVPAIVFSRVVQWSTSTTDDTANWDDALSTCLLALISFAHAYEGIMVANDTTLGEYEGLAQVLRGYLTFGNLWDEHPKDLQPLHFALRTNIVVSFSRMASWKSPRDFTTDTLLDRPWEMALRSIRASDRIYFTFAACRGLVAGGDNLKMISSYVMSLCLAAAALTAFDTGRTIEWASRLERGQREDANAWAFKYVLKLYAATVTGWEHTVPKALRVLPSVEMPPVDPSSNQRDPIVTKCLVVSLAQASTALHLHAIKMLKHCPSLERIASYAADASVVIKNIAMVAVYDIEGMQNDGLELLIKFAMADVETAKLVLSALRTNVQIGLSKNTEGRLRLSTMLFLQLLLNKLSTKDDSSTVVATPIANAIISDVIPDLINLMLPNSAAHNVRQAAIELSQMLWPVNGSPCLPERVNAAVLGHLKAILNSRKSSERCDLLHDLQDLVDASEFPSCKARLPYTLAWCSPVCFIDDIVATLFEDIVETAIHDEDPKILAEAQDLLKQLAKSDRFNGDLPRLDSTPWRQVVADRLERVRVRHNALLVIKIFSRQQDAASPLIKFLVKTALVDGDNDIRAASLDLALDLWGMANSADHGRVAQEVKDIVESELYKGIIRKESYSNIRGQWVSLLGEVAKHVAFPGAIPIIMEVAASKGAGPVLRSKAVSLLLSDDFTKEPKYRDLFTESIPKDLQVKLPCNSAVFREAQWVKLLVNFLPREELRGVVKRALFGVLSGIKDDLNVTLERKQEPESEEIARSGGHREGDSVEESAIAQPLRFLIGASSQDGRMYWAQILANLTQHFPEQFPKAAGVVLQIAIDDPDGDVRVRALRSLRPLANQGGSPDATRESLFKLVAVHIDAMAHHHDWNVRLALAQLLAAFAASKDCTLPDEATTKLTQMAREDKNDAVRCESVKSLANLVAKKDQYTNLSTSVLEMFEAGTEDKHWEVRKSWIELILPHIKDANSQPAKRVFHVAISDGAPNVRRAATDVLKRILRDANLRNATAAKLGKLFVEVIKRGECYTPIATLLMGLTTPAGDTNSEIAPTPGHEIWVGVMMLLGRNDFDGVPKMIELAIKAVPKGSYRDLKVALAQVTLKAPIPPAIAKGLKKALQSDVGDACLQGLTLFGHLMCSEDSKEWGYGDLLGRKSDAQLVSSLTEIAIKHDEPEMRQRSLKLLVSLFDIVDRFQDSVKISLSKIIKASLSEPSLMKFRANAITALRTLTEPNSSGTNAFEGIISPSVTHLLELVLNESLREEHGVRRVVEDILLEGLTICRELSSEVLLAIPGMIPKIFTVEAKRVALQLGDALQLTDDAALSIANALPPLLRAASPFSRATAIGFLAKLCSKHPLLRPRLMEHAIPEITAMALDEKDDVDIRTTAIQLLIALSAPITGVTNQQDGPIENLLVKQIAPLSLKFMGLLQNESLRRPAIRLLSVLSTDAAVRRVIVLQIIALAFGEDQLSKPQDKAISKSILLGRHCELLTCLISDGRFGEEGTDKVMLIFASAMVTRPKLSQYRFEILTALWCRYRDQSIIPAGSEQANSSTTKNELADWFSFALFGRHATHYEVSMWLKRCKEWWPSKRQTDDPKHRATSEPQNPANRLSSAAPDNEHHDADVKETSIMEASSTSQRTPVV